MKKHLLILLLAVGSTVIASEPERLYQPHYCTFVEPCDVRQSYGYGSLGLGPFPIPLPTFGLGYRAQANHHGVDLSLQASTVVALTQVKANLLYHYYFKPDYCSQTYVGVGVGPSYVFGSGEHVALISPEFVVGKQYRNENNDLRFFQAQISFPTFSSEHDRHHRHLNVLRFPLVIFSYGIGF